MKFKYGVDYLEKGAKILLRDPTIVGSGTVE